VHLSVIKHKLIKKRGERDEEKGGGGGGGVQKVREDSFAFCLKSPFDVRWMKLLYLIELRISEEVT
jgi:hypothetical protein